MGGQLHLLEGVIAIAAGVLTFIWPDVTALALVLLIGIWAVASGVAEVVAAIRLRRVIEGEWLLALAGLLSIVAGIIILVRPGVGALGIALVFRDEPADVTARAPSASTSVLT